MSCASVHKWSEMEVKKAETIFKTTVESLRNLTSIFKKFDFNLTQPFAIQYANVSKFSSFLEYECSWVKYY